MVTRVTAEAKVMEWDEHRTKSLMSHTTKIFLHVTLKRVINKFKPEITEEQYGLVEGKGTVNAINIF